MRRFVKGLAVSVLACESLTTVSISMGAQDPPPLTPPVVLGAPVTEPETPLGPRPTVELPPLLEAKPDTHPSMEPGPPPSPGPAADHRPMLVIPGVNTPRPGQRPRSATANAAPPATGVPLTAPGELPPLAGPAETMPPGPTSVDARRPADPRRTVGGPAGRGGLPRVIESEVAGPNDPELAPDAPAGETPRTTTPRRPSPPPRRPSGLFGRIFPPSGGRPEDAGSSIRFQPGTDPASDAAVKRRVEKQIHDTLGNKLRSYEVRVVGREVVIRATTARFWQRRAVRSTLESLPTLSGYKTRILVDE